MDAEIERNLEPWGRETTPKPHVKKRVLRNAPSRTPEQISEHMEKMREMQPLYRQRDPSKHSWQISTGVDLFNSNVMKILSGTAGRRLKSKAIANASHHARAFMNRLLSQACAGKPGGHRLTGLDITEAAKKLGYLAAIPTFTVPETNESVEQSKSIRRCCCRGGRVGTEIDHTKCVWLNPRRFWRKVKSILDKTKITSKQPKPHGLSVAGLLTLQVIVERYVVQLFDAAARLADTMRRPAKKRSYWPRRHGVKFGRKRTIQANPSVEAKDIDSVANMWARGDRLGNAFEPTNVAYHDDMPVKELNFSQGRSTGVVEGQRRNQGRKLDKLPVKKPKVREETSEERETDSEYEPAEDIEAQPEEEEKEDSDADAEPTVPVEIPEERTPEEKEAGEEPEKQDWENVELPEVQEEPVQKPPTPVPEPLAPTPARRAKTPVRTGVDHGIMPSPILSQQAHKRQRSSTRSSSSNRPKKRRRPNTPEKPTVDHGGHNLRSASRPRTLRSASRPRAAEAAATTVPWTRYYGSFTRYGARSRTARSRRRVSHSRRSYSASLGPRRRRRHRSGKPLYRSRSAPRTARRRSTSRYRRSIARHRSLPYYPASAVPWYVYTG